MTGKEMDLHGTGGGGMGGREPFFLTQCLKPQHHFYSEILDLPPLKDH